MKLALIGATGTIGQRILHEALNRGHQVTAIVRNSSRLTKQNPNLRVVTADIFNPESVAQAVAGQDAVISAYGAPHGQDQLLVDVARSLIQGVKQAGVPRLLVVGGAGSLEVAPGVQLMDTPAFLPAWKANAQAQRDALNVYRKADLDWTYLSPAALIQPGERTGHYRTGGEQLVVDAEGNSHISAEDYAIAMLDEVEHPQHVRQRFTVAY